jgi:Flp pilus assembly protein TadG
VKKIALMILALTIGGAAGMMHKSIRMANAADATAPQARWENEQAAAQARWETEQDEKAAKVCRDAGGMPIWGCFTGKLAGCSPVPKKDAARQ